MSNVITAHLDPTAVLLLQGTIVLFVPFALWYALSLGRFFPLAAIQIFAGILLGPSIFGSVAPDIYKMLFSAELQGGVNALAAFAVILFGFKAGTETDIDQIADGGPTVVAVGFGGFFVTLAIGAAFGHAVAVAFPATVGIGGVPLFTIAFGLVIAASALPMLTSICRDVGLIRTRVGALALASTGMSEVLLWGGIAAILPFCSRRWEGADAALWAIASGVVSVLFVRFIAGPILLRLVDRGTPERVIMSAVMILLFAVSATTLTFGLHHMLGAFIVGLFLPERVRHLAADRLDIPTALVLMPFFFLSIGLKTSFSLTDHAAWTVFVLGLTACIGGRVLSSAVAARLTGESWPAGIAIGFLMQTKGLMGLVVVSAFADRGLFGAPAVSALVVMTVVSTSLTMPVCNLIVAGFGERLGLQVKPRPQPDTSSN
ncbi:MAG: cation:proton antiporter [Ancalomicrobiaceae bacterium]|nr:cation:proton antiporter [Ancalomicrobiaceae bacterium]